MTTSQPTATIGASQPLERAVAAAAEAARPLADLSGDERAGLLEAVAAALDDHVEELVAIADRETSLGTTRLTGEVARTSGQLRLFASVVREGAHLEVTIDHADPDATPPRPDLRRMLVPLGPVAVFSASNFPFAFSVAGGDTASALAAGCPVVVKAHSGHLELSRRTAEIVAAALDDAGAPAGTFALVEGRRTGQDLVQDPAITAVGFTGSVAGGRALFDLATSRPDPIPFYGELGSINPVVITAGAVAARADELAVGLTGSFTMGVGQFCTKPGVLLIPAETGFEQRLADAVTEAAVGPQRMLTDRMATSFDEGTRDLAAADGVETLVAAAETPSGAATPQVFATDVAALLADPERLLEERFGPACLLVRYRDEDERDAAVAVLPGSLTATVHAEPEEFDAIRATVRLLRERAGRVLFDGWPTGVAVTWSQHHGGPWPATTAPLHTSVGATAIRRFLRPVTFQDAPEALLPEALHEHNPLGVPRRVDGVLEPR
ncbi:aldehyde dehydrogenase (NADP(+)) [Egicoccus sp. AB-alg6-2]|uniref:aldehyde dehydrogenase (NADP(+)) n=1 Tax=Egicoccus sp. AB-alg6-2 TaxID=3242692 RepID=UPI00359D4C44